MDTSLQYLYNHYYMSKLSESNWLTEGRSVLTQASSSIHLCSDRLDDATWRRAVGLLLNTQGRVCVTGVGKSGSIGRKMAGTLSSTGTHAFFMHPTDALHGDLGMIDTGDVLVALSYSGETDELLAILPAVAKQGIPIISLTANGQSTLGTASAATLDVSVAREACALNLAPTTSTSVMLAVCDALCLTVMGARGFGSTDYAKLHPAGSLGRRLTMTVADIMRKGDAVAEVSPASTVMDTVLVITRAHAGAAVVVDRDRRVVGLLTDGDIRRSLVRGPTVFAETVGEIMTRNPGTVPSSILAADGLKRLDAFHPDKDSKAGEAPVVDGEGKLVGVLMLKDLIKAGFGAI